jgi:outer membrane protein OmpA-like peptidoglycan-associated protein
MSRLSVRSPDNWRAYDLWNLIIAILLAIAVIWFWMKNNGLSVAGCCGGAAVSTPAAAASAAGAMWGSDGKVTLTGVVKDAATKKAIVDSATAKYGAGNVIDQLTIDKNASSKVVLTGTVPTEAEKKTRGDWAASLYGPGVTIDNQIVVQAPAAPPTPAVAAKPPTEKIYFLTSNTEMDQKGRDSVARIVTYLKANASAKAVISGFHDPRGNKAQNELLAKDRAKSVRDELRAASIDEARIVMKKPEETTGSGDLAEARRVELSVE